MVWRGYPIVRRGRQIVWSGVLKLPSDCLEWPSNRLELLSDCFEWSSERLEWPSN